jgi:CBS domain containing-hemolysin-like protein
VSPAGRRQLGRRDRSELLRDSSREGSIERDEGELSEAALSFGDTRAREMMKSRGEIDFVLTTDSADEGGGLPQPSTATSTIW